MKRVKYYSSDNRLIFKGSWSLRLVPELYSQGPVLTGQSRLPCGPLGGRRSRHSSSHLVLAAACAILTRSLPLSPCFLPFLEALDSDFQSWLALCSETPTEWVQSSRVALPFHEITSISMQSCEHTLRSAAGLSQWLPPRTSKVSQWRRQLHTHLRDGHPQWDRGKSLIPLDHWASQQK